MTDRWTGYGQTGPTTTAGWTMSTITGPSALWGANGILLSPTGELIVTQVFGAQVTAAGGFGGAAPSSTSASIESQPTCACVLCECCSLSASGSERPSLYR